MMRQRRDFLAAAKAHRAGRGALSAQARARSAAEIACDGGGARMGFTCSKKVGGAVTRNRAKRRLRAVVAQLGAARFRPGWDYVFIGRRDATTGASFATLLAEAESAIAAMHRKADAGGAR